MAPQGAWWLRADRIAAAPAADTTEPRRYRLGNGVLQFDADLPELIGAFDDHYGECATADAVGLPTLRATLRLAEAGRLAVLRFAEPAPSAFELALALLQHPAAAPLYGEAPARLPGWRCIEQRETASPAVVALGGCALFDRELVPLRVLTQALINPVLAAQREMLFAHAASVGVGGRGVLLVGPSRCGKTTTALTLASRGHPCFGDDMAAIRTATAELQPFWRTAHVRPGPHASALAGVVARGEWDAPYADGLPRLRLRIGELFPQPVEPVPLRLALFLRGFAPQPRLQPFAPGFDTFAASERFSLNATLWVAWGTTPPLRLLQFLAFQRLLAGVRCAWLDVGDPEPTADLIEKTMEEASWA